MIYSLLISFAIAGNRPTPRDDAWVQEVGCRLAEKRVFPGLPMSENPRTFGRYEFAVAVYSALYEIQVERKECLRLSMLVRGGRRWKVEARQKLAQHLEYLDRWTEPTVRDFVLLERELAPMLEKLGADTASLYPLVDGVVHLPPFLKSIRRFR